METTPVKIKHELPKLADLMNTDLIKLEEVNELNIILNQPPPANWLEENPGAKDKKGKYLKYLPIARVEYLLTRIFFQWKCEIKKTQLIGNAVVVEVRLHYFNPVTDAWDWQDGVGAAALQTKKGAGATDFMQLQSYAVMLAAPAAKSYAIKDAAHMLGAIFGKDLVREDKMNYDTLAENPIFNAKEEKLKEQFED
jgi:hypothetical protein